MIAFSVSLLTLSYTSFLINNFDRRFFVRVPRRHLVWRTNRIVCVHKEHFEKCSLVDNGTRLWCCLVWTKIIEHTQLNATWLNSIYHLYLYLSPNIKSKLFLFYLKSCFLNHISLSEFVRNKYEITIWIYCFANFSFK